MSRQPVVEVDSAFPTGNGVVTISGRDVVVGPDLRGSVGDRWYWHVRIRVSRPVVVEVTMARPGLVGRHGPAVSTDGGVSYRWLGAGPDTGGAFRLTCEPHQDVRAAATIPYGPTHLAAFVDRTSRAEVSGAGVTWTALASVGDRCTPVPLLRVQPNEEPVCTVLACARHHACEASGSYVLEGFVESYLSLRGVRGSIAARSGLVVVPMVDLPGVIAGDQGKSRMPRDHNRDYGVHSRYVEVRALRDLDLGLAPLFAVDFHTPGLVGEIEERPFLVSSAAPRDLNVAKRMLHRLARAGALEPDAADASLIVFNQEWNRPGSAGERGFAAWARSRPNTRAAITVEYPNASDRGHPVKPTCAREFGARLAEAFLGLAGSMLSEGRS